MGLNIDLKLRNDFQRPWGKYLVTSQIIIWMMRLQTCWQVKLRRPYMMGLVMTELIASRWNTENSTSSLWWLSGLYSCRNMR